MTSLQPFLYGSLEVRTVSIDGEPWFIASDVCRILDLSNPSVVVGRLDEDERSKFNLGRQGQASIVNESGLYSLILGSRKEEAREFQRWIKREVLPQIRKTGSYGPQSMDLTSLDGISAILDAGKAALNRAVEAEARAAKAESTVGQIEASNGLTPTQFHKHYFSDVPARVFFEKLYALNLLIDQRNSRVNAKGELRDGHEHGHPSYKGKKYFYLHGRLDKNKVRRESTRVRPGGPEIELKDFLASKGLPANQNSNTLFKEIAA